jgi:hypothetical protein
MFGVAWNFHSRSTKDIEDEMPLAEVEYVKTQFLG